MRFENRFDVDAPLESVWEAMLDVERVAPTVPGAQVLEQVGEDAYKVAIKVKVGPMSMTYNGEVEITERDDAAHRAVMKARAKESRGQGTADADVTMVLAGENGRTAATVTTEVALSGKVATMGQAVLQDVSRRLVATFAENLAAMLAGGGAPEPPAPAPPAATSPPAPTSPPASTSAPAATSPPASTSAPAATSPPASTSSPASTSPPAATSPPAPTAPPPPRAERQAPPADALDLGSLGGAVLAERLRRPETLPFLLAAVALIAFLLGRRSARG